MEYNTKEIQDFKYNSRERKWFISLNNPYYDINTLMALLSNIGEIRYSILGNEIGEKGTKHIQGYIAFVNAIQYTSIAPLMINKNKEIGYITKAKGNDKENFDYCSKDNDYIEYGNIESLVNDDSYASLINDIIEGLTIKEIITKYPKIALKNYNNLWKMYNDISPLIKINISNNNKTIKNIDLKAIIENKDNNQK